MLDAFKEAGYGFITFSDYCEHKTELDAARFVILRHDVDLRAENSLYVARIEHEHGVRASFYFRVVNQSNKPEVIKAIVEMGHEIGYHYEDMAICEGDAKKALTHFEEWLYYFRQYYPVKTICMHGSPRSRFDGRDLWKQYDYHGFGIIGEPYFDVDFSMVFYLTDTGRRWDGFHVSVRDKIPVFQEEWIKRGWVFHSTDDVMQSVESGTFPPQVMITTHPQRWTDKKMLWLKEYIMQSVKNEVKGIMVSKKFCNFAPKSTRKNV